jgi:hypothetical protein
LVDVAGKLSSTSKPKASLSVTIGRNDYFSEDRERLHLEASDTGTEGFELKLWETRAERLSLRDRYQKALKRADDVEVVLRSSKQTLLVGSLDLESRRLTLSELSQEPLALERHSDAGPACQGNVCSLELSAFEPSPDLTVLLVVTAGESCGAKCSELTEAQIWTLGPDGFMQGATLPGTDRMPGGINYGGRSSHTRLCWTEADGVPPLEILVVHTDSEKEDATVSVVGFDPDTRTYSRTEEQPPLPRDGYPQYCGSPLGEF